MLEMLSLLPSDPLLGLIAKYQDDNSDNKIDLGVGVFKDESGQTPILESVKLAEKMLFESEQTKNYVGPLGNRRFNLEMAHLLFGEHNRVIEDGRLTMVQTTGGCGALRVAAELSIRSQASTRVWVSDPTWANHIPLLGNAGLTIASFPYYDFSKHEIQFDKLIDCLSENAKQGDLVLLHGCCHNPCGADLSQQQWIEIVNLMNKKGLIPFIDVAYLGFGDGIEQDSFGARLVAEKCEEALFTVSCSKNFGLYRERVGAIGVLCSTKTHTDIAVSHIINIARGIYSMPPSHGASIVETILCDSHLKALWLRELEQKRMRIVEVRKSVVSSMQKLGFGEAFSYIEQEKGMFSFLGLNYEQVEHLIENFSIYMAETSRICLAGLNKGNIDYFCHSVGQVLQNELPKYQQN